MLQIGSTICFLLIDSPSSKMKGFTYNKVKNNKKNMWKRDDMMCTCMTFKTKDHYFGRNLDLEYRFNEKVVITPRNYPFSLKSGKNFQSKYAFIGAATVIDHYPLYAEATNEKGLSIASLQFPENAYYNGIEKEKINITPYEFIPWALGNFSSIEELGKELISLNITNIPFKEGIPVSPLHFMVSDDKYCIVVEPMKGGVQIYFNNIGILTNNPPFSFHLTNINNYLNLTPDLTKNRFSTKINLDTYSLGMGAIGLPGDNSSASRFIRSAFNRLNSVCESDEESSISQFFHILDSVTVIRGTTMTKDKKWNITTYSCCMNTTKGIYYYKTYHNSQITSVRMNEENKNKDSLTIYDLEEHQQIRYMN